MVADDYLAFLNLIGADNVQVGEDWLQCSCPFAVWSHDSGSDSRPSFGIRLADGHAHCFSCGFSGEPVDVVYWLRYRKGPSKRWGEALDLIDGIDAARTYVPKRKKKRKLLRFPESMLKAMPLAYWRVREQRGVHSYLRARRVSYATARDLDLRYDKREARICFPVRTADGVLRGIHGRSVNPDARLVYRMYDRSGGGTNPQLWYGEEWVDFDRPVLVVESVFDLVRAIPLYPNTIAALSASIGEQKAKRLRGASALWLLFDRDKAGERARLSLASFLPAVLQGQLYVPKPYKDPGEMPAKALARVLTPLF